MQRPDAFIDLGCDITPASAALARLYIIFGMAGLAVKSVTIPRPRPIYAPRTWADLHVIELGWGLIGSVFTLIGIVIWLVAR